jgi:tetratricopeptide (TPR) repeat protein
MTAGASRLAMNYSLLARSLPQADLAARLAPADPESHFGRAWLLTQSGDLPAATAAFERAIELRPRDHVLWLELGKVRERAGDAEGALNDFREAVRLAPFYAQPRWQLGNTLLRVGRSDEAVEELRRAAESDPALYPNFVQTIWYAGGRDPQTLSREARPRTVEQTLALVRFLIKEGAAGEGMRVLRESGAEVSVEARRSLLADLISAYDYADAYEVWSGGKKDDVERGVVNDGGFEAEARTDDEGFGWRFARENAALKLSLDSDSPREGGRSLKVEYAGNSEPNVSAVSQLMLVEPGARYRLSFSERTRELVTGGPPFVQIVSASKAGEVLASSAPLSSNMTGWQDFAIGFTATPTAGAVRVVLKRQPCTSSPCPAFGSVWLDAFELRRL